jgi:hypothetical protein
MKLNLQLSCYNGARYLPFLFRSLAAQTDKDWHLYLLDNASTIEEADAIRAAVNTSGLPITLARVELNIGFAGAHNMLFGLHRADLVQLLNDDAILEPRYLEICRKYLLWHAECAAVSGAVFRWDFDRRDESGDGKTEIIDTLGLETSVAGRVVDIGAGQSAIRNPQSVIPTDPTPVFGVSGCLPMYRVSAVRAASMDGVLFDRSFISYKEDVDLAYRLTAAGFTAMTLPLAVAYHRRSSGVGVKHAPRPEAAYNSFRNHLWIVIAHTPARALLWSRIGVIPFELAKICYWLVKYPKFVRQAFRETVAQWPTLMCKRAFMRLLARTRREFTAALPYEADICVVMVTHNDLSEECLVSLAAARTSTKLSIKLVVADNDSNKQRANEFVAPYLPDAIVLLRNRDWGYGRSCNRAAQEVRARYYFILNPDTVLSDARIFDTLYAYMRTHPQVGLAAPKILYFDGRLQETCRRFPAWYMPIIQRTALKDTAYGVRYTDRFLMHDYDHERERAVDWVQGSAMFIDGETWQTLNGFDDRYFMYFEDIDLCRRMHILGKDVVYLPATTLKHAHGKESAKLPGIIRNVFGNDMARAHIVSWLKYSAKWGIGKPPAV